MGLGRAGGSVHARGRLAARGSHTRCWAITLEFPVRPHGRRSLLHLKSVGTERRQHSLWREGIRESSRHLGRDGAPDGDSAGQAQGAGTSTLTGSQAGVRCSAEKETAPRAVPTRLPSVGGGQWADGLAWGIRSGSGQCSPACFALRSLQNESRCRFAGVERPPAAGEGSWGRRGMGSVSRQPGHHAAVSRQPRGGAREYRGAAEACRVVRCGSLNDKGHRQPCRRGLGRRRSLVKGRLPWCARAVCF